MVLCLPHAHRTADSAQPVRRTAAAPIRHAAANAANRRAGRLLGWWRSRL